MNKKMIFSIIGIALLVFIGVALYNASKLRSIQIVKTVTINGTKEEAFNMVRFLNNFPKWSPFLAQDPTQKYEVKGIDGTVGAQYHWVGNKGKDVGHQEITKLDSFNFIRINCEIQKPFEAKPTFDYLFQETAHGIKVTQDFKLHSSLKDGFFLWIFGVKAQMGKINQQGLDLLKNHIEKQ